MLGGRRQPLVIGGLVIAATEGDTFYGLSRSGGRILWRAHLGTPAPLSSQPCGGVQLASGFSAPVNDLLVGSACPVARGVVPARSR